MQANTPGMSIRLKTLSLFITIVSSIIITSCGNAKTKADAAAGKIGTDTMMEKVTTEKKNEPVTNDSADKKNGYAGILANIDKYLVCEAKYDQPGPNGGIVNGIVSVKNLMPDITVQKAIVEVTILLYGTKEFLTNYYTVVNIGPGETKIIKLPTASRGTKVLSHIVKIKSDSLTNSEMVLVGNHYVPE